jgi:hypothetical protein
MTAVLVPCAVALHSGHSGGRVAMHRCMRSFPASMRSTSVRLSWHGSNLHLLTRQCYLLTMMLHPVYIHSARCVVQAPRSWCAA